MTCLGHVCATRGTRVCVIEIDLVERTLGDFVKNSWEKSRPLFEQMRATLHDPYLAEYFEWLAKRLDARMTSAPRTPAYATSG